MGKDFVSIVSELNAAARTFRGPTRPARISVAGALVAAAVLLAGPRPARADNPVVQTSYTADPFPLVYDGTLYLYTDHDEDVTVNNFYTMNDWKLYTTTDMVNWTDHGTVLKYQNFSWSTGNAWAGQVINRNGKFYFYVPITASGSNSSAIGVAVADSPTGPFKDALGKPLIASPSGNIDPTVFIDDDGQAYLYWGNPDLLYVKLNQDMISYSGGIVHVSMTTSSFGARSGNAQRPTLYEEGPWFYKRGSLYYLVFASDCCSPEKIDYATSTGPTGTWTYRARIMDDSGSASFTNHPGVVDYNGKSYFFYHNGALPGGNGYRRSVCVEQFNYNADGTIPAIKMTSAGPAALANLNPYAQVEAETMAFSGGPSTSALNLKTEACSEGGMDVTSISNGDYIKVKAVDFGGGATSFSARVASAANGGKIELRLDGTSGTLVGTCTVPVTGGAQTWMTISCPVSGASGLHDLVLKFTGGSGDLFKFNWWKFTAADGNGGGGAGGSAAGGAGGQVAATGGAGGRSSGAGGTPAGSGGAAGARGSGGSGPGGPGSGGSGAGGSLATGGASGLGGQTGATGGSFGTGGGPGGSGIAGDSSGCSCRTGNGAGRGGAFMVLLAGWLARRRRRRAG